MSRIHVSSCNKNCGGFSLIEMSIALVIIALFIVPLAILYQNTVAQTIMTKNRARMSEIQENINFFAVSANRYPAPASLYAAPGDADYGREYSGPIPGCAGWPSPFGVCRVGGGPTAILIGAVPFAALGINPDTAHDYWDNKFLYAVTMDQTTSYDPGEGKITVQGYDWNATRVLTPFAELYDMVLVSLGENGRGAYTRNGVAQAPCADIVTAMEEENCDMDDVFVTRSYTKFNPGSGVTETIGMSSYLPGADYYDDFTVEQISVPQDLWLQSLYDDSFALTFASRIGVGTADPQARVHVMGGARADRLLTDSACNGEAVGCFNPEIIGGAVPAMDCNQNTLAGKEPVLSIGNSEVYCASPVNTSGAPLDGEAYVFPAAFFTWNVDCAATSKNMVGIDAAGTPICN